MDKVSLRRELRAARREHVAALPDSVRALIFSRPPAPLLDAVPADGAIGLYFNLPDEAPTGAYTRFFHENGRTVSLPRFADRDAPMEFAVLSDPYDYEDCEVGPFGVLQPPAEAKTIAPPVVFAPLLGFTEQGDRLGQGGGHYDRWLASHPDTFAVGMGWDLQRRDTLPFESHDIRLNAVVTPTRLYGPF